MKRQQITKITCFIILLTVSYFPSFSQALTKGSVFANISAGFVKPITPEYFQNNTPLMLNGKAGWLLRDRLSLSLEANTTNYSADIVRLIDETDPMGSYRMIGILKDKSFSVGLSLGKHFRLAKKLYFISSVYGHYLHNTFVEEGYYATAIEEPTGDTYRLSELRGYFGRAGLSGEINYFFTSQLAGTLHFAQLDLRLSKREQKLYLEAPFLIGISYHLK